MLAAGGPRSDPTSPMKPATDLFLTHVPPMGIYATLYAFLDSFGTYMGEPGTHPWSQGFPRTEPLPNGPEIPATVTLSSTDLMYPKAWGHPRLREAVAASYRTHYGAPVDAENVMIFAGGRPGLIALLLFLQPDVHIRIAETEYTPYFDMLRLFGRAHDLLPSGPGNGFLPTIADYLGRGSGGRRLAMLSNPCNPTGITRSGADLAELVGAAHGEVGLLVDEAYEFFHDPPVSALAHVDDLEASNLFVCGAATKGLQVPGLRIGWVVAAKRHIEILSNFSSFGMGGVSHPSQLLAVQLLEAGRLAHVRRAIPEFYGAQRERYGNAFADLGLELFSGDGGFYHWCRLANGMTAEELNQRLFPLGAAILKGTDCDMARRGAESPLATFFRFSFGPLAPDSFEGDLEILRGALQSSPRVV